jgi:hypothetical protein
VHKELARAEAAVRRFISSQENLPFSYENVGASREGAASSGYAEDRNRV